MKKIYRRLGQFKAEDILMRLREVRDIVTMKNAVFGFNDSELTNMIRNETQLWRDTWIIRPIDLIISELNEIYGLEII